ncbi:MAG: carboxymuconolactone decarboxylase family protein [Desulfobulbia bacterium]
MTYFLDVTEPEKADAQLTETYDHLLSLFHTTPKVFMAQSIRPDLLAPLVVYVDRLMFQKYALSRETKELIAAYISKLNSCEYCVDAHSAFAMAQGFSREEVQSVLDDIDNSSLIDEKTKLLLKYAGKINKEASKIDSGTVQALKDKGCTDEELFETVAVTALFNFMDRMADSLGAPIDKFQDMVEQGKL